jgi:hypothetical protein
MRLTILSFLLLSYIVLAIPVTIAVQETAVIEKWVKNVSNSLKQLSNAIQALDPDLAGDIAKQETDIENRSLDVINSLRDGASEIKRRPMVITIEITRLVDIVESITAQTQTTMNIWANAKPIIVQAGGREPVLRILTLALKATDDFTDAIVSRLPLTGIVMGRLYAQRSKAVIEQTIANFKT